MNDDGKILIHNCESISGKRKVGRPCGICPTVLKLFKIANIIDKENGAKLGMAGPSPTNSGALKDLV